MRIVKPMPNRPAAVGLAALSRVVLDADEEASLTAAAALSRGPAAWRHCKRANARDVIALSHLAPRLSIIAVDLRTDLRVLIDLRTPVPCLPDPAGDLILPGVARLVINYPERALRTPLPGHAVVRIQAPARVHHPNVSPDSRQALCLGAQLPVGIPLREIVLSCYGALTMQTIQIDEWDPAGVLNIPAARWWQENLHRVPLSSEPFLGDPDGGRS